MGDDKKKPISIKFGINHITKLCEQKKAQLVCIAHDVDPIELVMWLPAVCRKMDIRQQDNENAKAIERSWGGGIMGVKSQAATAKTEKALAKEMAKKAMM